MTDELKEWLERRGRLFPCVGYDDALKRIEELERQLAEALERMHLSNYAAERNAKRVDEVADEARKAALEEVEEVIGRFVALAYNGVIGGRSIREEKQAVLRDLLQAIRNLKDKP